MSGGLEENFLLKNSPETHPDLWKILVKSRQLKSMNAAYIEPDSGLRDQQLPNGLVKVRIKTSFCLQEEFDF